MEGKYVQMTINDWLALKGQLEAELRGAAAGFVRIGYLLRKIDETEGYKNDGSKSLAEWAKDNYGLSATAVSRFVAINKKYSIDGYSDQLRLEYAQYGSAKLSEMLALPDSDLEMVSPEMKREDIREIKKFNKEAAKEEAKAEEPAADQREEPHEEHHEEQAPQAAAAPELPDVLPEHKWIIEFFRENKEIMNDLYSSKAYAEGNVDGMKEIVNPSGARTYRHRMTMVSMMDARIMVKVFPKSPDPMSWGGFFQIAADIFGEKIDGKNTYRNVFGEKETKSTAEKPESVKSEAEPKKAEPAAGKTEPETPIALAQKEPATIGNSNVKTDSAIAEEPAAEPVEEPEQVEIDEILPAPEEPDPMRDLKDRFTAEINSLKIMLDCENFAGMAQTIERLEQLRIKMAGLAATAD
jgi:hypothetical protein